MDSVTTAKICRALGDSNRLRIVELLTSGEKCACKLLESLAITQSTLSHHIKILADCDLIFTRHEGKWSYFTLNCETLGAFRAFVGGLVCGCGSDAECAGRAAEER